MDGLLREDERARVPDDALGDAIGLAVNRAIADAEFDANRHLKFVVLTDGEPDHVYDSITNTNYDPLSDTFTDDDPAAITAY